MALPIFDFWICHWDWARKMDSFVARLPAVRTKRNRIARLVVKPPSIFKRIRLLTFRIDLHKLRIICLKRSNLSADESNLTANFSG